ncbi:hypothetical protein OH807_18375 [Kitasatospora sp. NBC_01560]|uniref:hypothetical protein n=1 Tax=Kitasatospora sp. NBC_01560 TaxID=2975965 RepID=UPI003864F974
MSTIQIPRRYLVEIAAVNHNCGERFQETVSEGPLSLPEAAAELTRTAYELAAPAEGAVSLEVRDGLPVATCSLYDGDIVFEISLRLTFGPAVIVLLSL